MKLDPDAKAIVAAWTLRSKGRRVSVSAACKLGGVDRGNLIERRPDAVALIEKLADRYWPLGDDVRLARDADLSSIDGLRFQDQRLARLVAIWASLPESIRDAISAIGLECVKK